MNPQLLHRRGLLDQLLGAVVPGVLDAGAGVHAQARIRLGVDGEKVVHRPPGELADEVEEGGFGSGPGAAADAGGAAPGEAVEVEGVLPDQAGADHHLEVLLYRQAAPAPAVAAGAAEADDPLVGVDLDDDGVGLPPDVADDEQLLLGRVLAGEKGDLEPGDDGVLALDSLERMQAVSLGLVHGSAFAGVAGSPQSKRKAEALKVSRRLERGACRECYKCVTASTRGRIIAEL